MGIFGGLFDALTEKDRWMRRAAGVSTMRLICHVDTWEALELLPSGSLNSNGGIEANDDRITVRDDGMREIVLSGPEVVRLLQVTHYNKKYGTPEDRAIAERAYQGFGAVLDTVGPHHDPDTEIPAVVLDDRPPASA